MAGEDLFRDIEKGMNEGLMTTIYQKVNELLGAGNQLFVMEFPTRPLNPRDYEYKIEDSYASMTKPYTVQEAEFLLSDQLFDCSPIVQGPNGEKLSTVYSTVINNYVPKLNAMENFVADQKGLRQWLLSAPDGATEATSRMEIAKELYGEYLKARNEWNQKKSATYDRYKQEDGLDEYAKWLSSEGVVQEEILNNYFNDAVVRGHYHEVLTLLGYLNVASPAETLETTKQKMRASMRRSLDGSSDVYPVNFQPSDWFKALKPNISPKDLTMAKDKLVDEFRAKQKRLRSLQEQLSEYTVIEVPVEEQVALKEQVEVMEAQVAKSESEMMKKYGVAALSGVKAVLNVYKSVANPVQAVKEALADGTKKSDLSKLIEGIAEGTLTEMLDQFEGMQVLLADLKKANEAHMAYSESKVKDMRLQKIRIEEQIQNVQADLDFLSPLVSGVLNPTLAGEFNNDVLTEDQAEEHNFTDIVITSEMAASQSSSSSSASASSSSWHIGGWFFSAGGSRQSSQATSEQRKKSLEHSVEIGFRIKKVTFDRGGWFNPNLFKLSSNFFRLTEMRVSKGLNKNDVVHATRPNAAANELNNLTSYTINDKGQNKLLKYLLPAYPTGFVIAKDITIKIKADKTESESMSSYFESSSNASGGAFCFKYSRSDSSKSSNESAYFGSTSNHFYMRIPGPQVLGWFLQFTPPDASSEYKGIDTNIYKTINEKLNPSSDTP